MTQVATDLETLENHAALASRLIRSKPALLSYFRWLNRPSTRGEPTQRPSEPVRNSLDALIEPLRLDADRITQRETESASLWLGSVCEYLAQRHQVPGNQHLLRLVAAGLLPLYRALATGRLQEGLAQTRHRLGEALVLASLTECLHLHQILDSHTSHQCSPQRTLAELLKIDILNVHYLLSSALDGYNQAKDEFNADSRALLSSFRISDKLPNSHVVPEWAEPQLLWVLSNELTSSRSELVLPRSWLDTPVPWSKISAHWIELESHLSELRPECDKFVESSELKAVRSQALPPKNSTKTQLSKHSSLQVDLDSSAANSSSEPLSSREDSNSKIVSEKDSKFALSQAEAIVEAAQSGWDSLETMDVIDQVIEQELYRRTSTNSSTNSTRDTQSTNAKDGSVARAGNTPFAAGPSVKKEPVIIPKVLIGEISNHNDPAFGNVVRRQVAVCKQEDRSICLSMIQVIAEDQRENHSLSAPNDNGLNRWQQKLVNWICDHPELKQPSAFVTRDAQLILVVMDSERNSLTRILRQGLVEVLTGQKNNGDGDLSKVNIPAKFHAGISSTSSPSASFESEELIASAHRCFTAAQRLGSASIKSIEVY